MLSELAYDPSGEGVPSSFADSRGQTLEVLKVALAELHDATGVIYVVGTKGEARICLCRGRIAWVHAGNCGTFLSDRLSAKLAMNANELRTMLVTCRRKRRPLGEHVVALGLLSRGELRELLQSHNREHLNALLASGAADYAGWSFEDRPDSYNPSFTFDLPTLLADPEQADGAVKEAVLSVLAELELADGDEAWVLDRSNGQTWGDSALPPAIDGVLAQIGQSVCRGGRAFELLALCRGAAVVASATDRVVVVLRGTSSSCQPRLLRIVRGHAERLSAIIDSFRSPDSSPTDGPARTPQSCRRATG